MAAGSAIPEKQISEFVERLQQAAGMNLDSVILYGSAASGDYDPEYSNINLLCILKDTAFPKLQALASAAKWWTKQKYPTPLMITREELARSADVFAIELMEIQMHHRVLFGEDAVGSLQIPMHLHRAQLEYELGEKLIQLRQQLLLAAGDKQRIWDLLLISLPAFATLFRHARSEQGQPGPSNRREVLKALAGSLEWDASPFEKVLDIREHRADRRQFNVEELAGLYLAAAEQVTAAVDQMLDTSRPRS